MRKIILHDDDQSANYNINYSINHNINHSILRIAYLTKPK